MTLEQIIEAEKARRTDGGTFGIDECKRSIKSALEIAKLYGKNTTLFTLLGEYYDRAKEDKFFNKAMILACWELINGGAN